MLKSKCSRLLLFSFVFLFSVLLFSLGSLAAPDENYSFDLTNFDKTRSGLISWSSPEYLDDHNPFTGANLYDFSTSGLRYTQMSDRLYFNFAWSSGLRQTPLVCYDLSYDNFYPDIDYVVNFSVGPSTNNISVYYQLYFFNEPFPSVTADSMDMVTYLARVQQDGIAVCSAGSSVSSYQEVTASFSVPSEKLGYHYLIVVAYGSRLTETNGLYLSKSLNMSVRSIYYGDHYEGSMSGSAGSFSDAAGSLEDAEGALPGIDDELNGQLGDFSSSSGSFLSDISGGFKFVNGLFNWVMDWDYVFPLMITFFLTFGFAVWVIGRGLRG